MMCEMDKDLLQMYIDQELNEPEKILLGEHLKGCPACRRELNQLKLLDWELCRQSAVTIPTALSHLREMTLNACFEQLETTEDSFGIKDVLNVQIAAIKGATQFTQYLPGQTLLRWVQKERTEASPQPTGRLNRLLGMKAAR